MRMSKHNQPIFHLRMGRVGNRQRKRVGENCRRLIEANAVLRQIGSGLVFVPLKIERHRATLACDRRGDKRDLAHRARIPTRHPGTQVSRFRSSDGFPAGAGKRVLRIYRRASHCSCNRTHAEKKRDRIDANRFISSGARDNELAPKAFGAGRVEQVLREAETWICCLRL